MLRAIKIWLLMVPAVAMLLTACINDDFTDDGTGVEGELPAAGDVFIRFRLSLGDDMASRAEGESLDSLTPGTADERRINSIDILVFASENSSDYRLVDVVYLNSDQIAAITGEKGLVVPLAVAKGQKLHIYAGVNLSPWMRSKFIIDRCGTDVSLASTGADSWDVMNDFIPGSGGKAETLGSSGIPMTGQFVLDGSQSADIEITQAAATANVLTVTANVSRIVAKVHLLAQTEIFPVVVNQETGQTEDITFAVAKDNFNPQQGGGSSSKEDEEWLGWMRLKNVRYIINGTNKSTYLFPQINEAGKNKDLNMSLAAYRNGDYFDESLWDSDFDFYDGVAMHSTNISNSVHFGNAEAYDETKLYNTANGGTDYTKGLYCLENYFDIPADEDFYSGQKSGVPAVTHLSIATKLAPRYLVVLTDFPSTLDKFFAEAEDANYSAQFYNKYGMTKDDFGKADTKHWHEIKKTYFGDDYLNLNPDPNKPHGRSTVFRNHFYIFPALNEADALYFINWSLIARGLWSGSDDDFERGKYPKNTYFVYDTKYDEALGAADSKYSQHYIYLVAGAVALATGENMGIKTYSVPHIGGWGYYYTYIDNYNGAGTVDGVTTFKASQVTRNNYYIITVENFGTPGGTITDPEYIKVNTVPIGWDYTGKGDIYLH